MKILALNSGSFSFKWELFNDDLVIEKEGNYEAEGIAIENNFERALSEIGDIKEISVIGHRVVHGGRDFTETTKITPEVLEKLKKYNNLAPLHNPVNLRCVEVSRELLTAVDSYAVFDTAFYKDLPEIAKVYAIPFKYYEEGIQRYGFHGISHNYVAEETAKKLNKPLEECNLITIHLGGGSSITAIKKGKAIDTSMGLTPLEGLAMGTRSGDIDAGLVLKLVKDLGSVEKAEELLNRQSGLKGLTLLNDFRDILKAKENGDEKANLAFNIFVYRIKKYIGAYMAILGGVHAVAFTGAIGAGQEITREAIISGTLNPLRDIPIFSFKTGEGTQIAKEIKKQICA